MDVAGGLAGRAWCFNNDFSGVVCLIRELLRNVEVAKEYKDERFNAVSDTTGEVKSAASHVVYISGDE
jgi:hypothetical protein